MRSLERSLGLGLLLCLALLLPLFWWGGTLTARSLLHGAVHADLARRASEWIDAFDVMGSSAPRPGPTQYWARLPEQGEPSFARGAERLGLVASIPRLVPGQSQRGRSVGEDGQAVLYWAGGFSTEGQRYTLVLAEDTTRLHARLRLFEVYFAVFALMLLVALWWAQRQIVRRALFRLHAVRREIRELDRGERTRLSEQVPAEIAPLVSEYNRLQARHEKRLRQSRNAAGNLAHALKTPLNLLVRAGEDNPEIAGPAERIRQLIDAELRRARVSGGFGSGVKLDLATELPSLVRLLAQVHNAKAVNIQYSIDPGLVWNGDRQDVLELIGNLLDNAVKWARTQVRLSIRGGEGLHLDVEDDGPGCSPAELARLTERGVRFDETVAGHGLGLSIVKDIVDSHSGSLQFSRSTRFGGLRVRVSLAATA